MLSLASLGARERSRTLVAQEGVVWIWPGIHLAHRCGAEVVPAANDVMCFWITRLHGPEALYKDISSAMSRAASFLTQGDEAKAQRALDSLYLFALSRDGAALMKAIAREFGIESLALQVRDGPATWTTRDVAHHLPFFKQGILASRALAKGAIPVFNPAKHPRWPAGAPDSQGGQFAPGDGSGASAIPVASPDQPGIGHNGGPPLEEPPDVPQNKPPKNERREWIADARAWLVNAIAAGATDAINRFISTLKFAAWANAASYYLADALISDLDGPKTWEELDRNRPGPGYETHHIVERKPGEDYGFSIDELESSHNEVVIPRLKHEAISNWYQTGNKDYAGLSPREYLRDKDWSERYKMGLYALVKFGVLKP